MNKEGIKSLTIPADGKSERVDALGLYFKLYSVSEPEGVLIRINGGAWEAVIASHVARPVDGKGIESVQFKNLSETSENTVQYAVWPYEINDNLVVITSDELAQLLEITRGPTATPTYGTQATDAGAAKKLLDINTTRTGYFIENPKANTDTVYIGFDDTVSPANYFASIPPNADINGERFRGEVWVYCASAQNIMVTEVG